MSCNPGYRLVDGDCVEAEDHCLYWDANGKCIVCDFNNNGYGLLRSNGSCILNEGHNHHCSVYITNSDD